MALRTDLLLDKDGDLPIDAVGLMPIGYSDKQHVKDLSDSLPGEWKQFPTNGVGLSRYLKATGTRLMFLKKDLRLQLQNDGYGVGNTLISIDANGKMTILPNAYRV